MHKAHKRRGITRVIFCPSCGWENSGDSEICQKCGEDLLGGAGPEKLLPVDPDSGTSAGQSIPPAAPPPEAVRPAARKLTPGKRSSEPPKNESYWDLAWLAGLFLLTILAGSFAFQSFHSASRLIFIVGIMTGLAIAYFKINARSLEGNTEDKVGSVLMAIIIVPIGILLLLLYFAFDYVVAWLFSGPVGEKFVVLAFGIVCGIVIEMARDHLLRSVNLMRR